MNLETKVGKHQKVTRNLIIFLFFCPLIPLLITWLHGFEKDVRKDFNFYAPSCEKPNHLPFILSSTVFKMDNPFDYGGKRYEANH